MQSMGARDQNEVLEILDVDNASAAYDIVNDSESDYHPFEHIANRKDPVISINYDGDFEVDVAKVEEVLLIMYDYMAKHKATDSSSGEMWQFLRVLLPEEHNVPTFKVVKDILERHIDKTVLQIDVCINDCVAFYDANCEELAYYKYKDLQSCPKCGEDRFIYNPSGNKMPKKFFFYFPCRYYFRDLFNMPDLVPFLYNNTAATQFPEGHLQRSRGWKLKVTDNANINQDRRNQTIIASTDGVPFFADKQSLSGWPLLLRSGNLPDGLWGDMLYCHMVGLYTCDYLHRHSITGKFGRIRRAPKSLQPLYTVLADELLRAERNGFSIKDSSLPVSDPKRQFMMKAILLFHVGDYPAQGIIYTLLI